MKAWRQRPESKNLRKKRKEQSKKANRDKDKNRSPREKKQNLQTVLTQKDAKRAHKALQKAGWTWRPPSCACGGTYNLASWKESQFRGRGRLFYRCYECRKFVDTLAHSHLLKLRMPLAHIHKAMEHYFQGAVCRPPWKSLVTAWGMTLPVPLALPNSGTP